MKKKALFLDRDGTINVEKNYLYKIEEFVFRDGIFDLAKAFLERGYLIFVVTNQSGIARGFYSENDYLYLTAWMVEQFRMQGIEIRKVYHCPHYPEKDGFCGCRKPEPGMLLETIREFDLDPGQCVVIGDSDRDLEAGRKAGITRLYKVKQTGKIDWKDVIIY
ncbi:MAG: D-glycero-alpha-D-manno-heptose-1,7-bisphosphate 7-phosphatase [Bacteroidota bacterium]